MLNDHLKEAKKRMATITQNREPRKLNDLDFCKKCHNVLTAGKCLNKGCKK